MTFEDNDCHGGLNIDFTLSKCAIEQSCGQQYVLNLVNGSFLNNLHKCSISQIHILYNNLRVEIWLAMIIRFQLGNLCMRNKGTLFRAQIIPTYHQTPIMCYQKPLLL